MWSMVDSSVVDMRLLHCDRVESWVLSYHYGNNYMYTHITHEIEGSFNSSAWYV